jgi:hypothetical protein
MCYKSKSDILFATRDREPMIRTAVIVGGVFMDSLS